MPVMPTAFATGRSTHRKNNKPCSQGRVPIEFAQCNGAPIAGILIAERKSDKFNLGTPRNAARRGTARARTSTQSGFWVPLKGRQRFQLAPGPLLRGVGGMDRTRFQKGKTKSKCG